MSNPKHLRLRARELQRQRQPDIAESDNGNFHILNSEFAHELIMDLTGFDPVVA
jgi:hypothetical protein